MKKKEIDAEAEEAARLKNETTDIIKQYLKEKLSINIDVETHHPWIDGDEVTSVGITLDLDGETISRDSFSI